MAFMRQWLIFVVAVCACCALGQTLEEQVAASNIVTGKRVTVALNGVPNHNYTYVLLPHQVCVQLVIVLGDGARTGRVFFTHLV